MWFSLDFMIKSGRFSNVDFALAFLKHFHEFGSESGAQMDPQTIKMGPQAALGAPLGPPIGPTARFLAQFWTPGAPK